MQQAQANQQGGGATGSNPNDDVIDADVVDGDKKN